jgi:hypothetical protein
VPALPAHGDLHDHRLPAQFGLGVGKALRPALPRRPRVASRTPGRFPQPASRRLAQVGGRVGRRPIAQRRASALPATKAAGILLGGGGAAGPRLPTTAVTGNTAWPGAGVGTGARRGGSGDVRWWASSRWHAPPAPADLGRPRGEQFPRSTAEPSPAIFSQHRPISTNIFATTSPLTLPQAGGARGRLTRGDAWSRMGA